MITRAVGRTAAALATLATLTAILVLVGCVGPAPAGHPSTADPAPVSAPAAGSAPTGLRIPAIEVHDTGPVMALGVDADGVVEVPPVEEPERLGWYELGVAPGDVGPAVLLGHVNGAGRDGVFVDLDQLSPGDEVVVDRGDGPARFEVYRVDTFPKLLFPTATVYGDTDGPELRLITCGGTWDPAARSYEDQVIAYARAT